MRGRGETAGKEGGREGGVEEGRKGRVDAGRDGNRRGKREKGGRMVLTRRKRSQAHRRSRDYSLPRAFRRCGGFQPTIPNYHGKLLLYSKAGAGRKCVREGWEEKGKDGGENGWEGKGVSVPVR